MKFLNTKLIIIAITILILSSCADPLVRLDTTKWKSFSNDNC